jgi:hypothetical protein
MVGVQSNPQRPFRNDRVNGAPGQALGQDPDCIEVRVTSETAFRSARNRWRSSMLGARLRRGSPVRGLFLDARVVIHHCGVHPSEQGDADAHPRAHRMRRFLSLQGPHATDGDEFGVVDQ